MNSVEPGRVGGNWYDKYASDNPVARWLVSGFERHLVELVHIAGAREAHEVGCGEGHLTRLLARKGLDLRGSDVSPSVIEEARKRTSQGGLDIPYRVADLFELEPERDAAELIVCCEVLEHLDDPEIALRVLTRLARPWLLLSVPREPMWRFLNLVRGSYVRRLGNTPGHVQHWSKRGFLAFLAQQVTVVEVRSPIPWTMALVRSDA